MFLFKQNKLAFNLQYMIPEWCTNVIVKCVSAIWVYLFSHILQTIFHSVVTPSKKETVIAGLLLAFLNSLIIYDKIKRKDIFKTPQLCVLFFFLLNHFV